MSNFAINPSSFRDPSGFIFTKEGELYRQVNAVFKEDFDLFISSGCYEKLVQQKWLIQHEVINQNLTGTADYYLTLKPALVPFISYPYEWPFEMLKDAALLTLHILRESIAHGLILKDATPYNIQWYNNGLIFIDSLSFEKYDETIPWVAYRQFCECFLSPLLLMYYKKQPLQPLQLAWPDGIPLRITKSLLPFRSKFSLHTYLHIHLHAGMAQRKKNTVQKTARFSKQKMLNLISSLETLVHSLKLAPQKSTWSAYYTEAAQRNDYLTTKKEIIQAWLSSTSTIQRAIDLGANDGEFSKLLAANSITVVATDFDPYCINNLYQYIKNGSQEGIQPLIIDLSNPSPANGVNNTERASFLNRARTDLVLALALIHHLAIGKNIPLPNIATLFAGMSHQLIIEFVPGTDEKIQLMLAGRKDIFDHYTQAYFEEAFGEYFIVKDKKEISTSGRILYFLEKK
jgi:hypothetical protein